MLVATTISTLMEESLKEAVQYGKRGGFHNEGVSTWSVLLLVTVDPYAFNSEKCTLWIADRYFICRSELVLQFTKTPFTRTQSPCFFALKIHPAMTELTQVC